MTIYEEIHDERVAQDKKRGGSSNEDKNKSYDWLAFIRKNAGRAVKQPWDRARFRQQMIRVAAFAVAAVEWCDRLDHNA